MKKQTQFVKGQKERNVNYNKDLWKYKRFRRAKKQSQFKANIECYEGFLPMMQEIATALRASQ